jgi:hypothetical protein
LIQIRLDGLPWFERFEHESEIMRTLQRDDEGETWGFGTKESPQRHVLLGCVELSRNNRKTAIEHLNFALEKLLKSPVKMPLAAQLERQLAELATE